MLRRLKAGALARRERRARRVRRFVEQAARDYGRKIHSPALSRSPDFAAAQSGLYLLAWRIEASGGEYRASIQ
jgi:hypothetical protein